MEKIDYNKMMTEVQKFIEDEEQRIELYAFLSKTLKKYDGCKITKRISSAINKQMESSNMKFVCVYSSRYDTMYCLDIYKAKQSNVADYDNYIMGALLGYEHATKIFDFDFWKKSNPQYLKKDGRLTILKNKMEQLLNRTSQWNSMVSVLENISKDMENIYPLSAYFDIN